MTNELKPGQTRFGYLVDGRDETPHQAAMLTYEEGRGAVLQVPYVLGEPQFAYTETWFRSRTDRPETLVFWDHDGYVTMTDLSWGDVRHAQMATGRIVPTTSIFGRPRLITSEYKVRQLGSQFDGLQAFSRFASLDIDHRAEGIDAVVTVHPSDGVRWRHGGYSFALRSTVPWSASYGQSFTAQAETIIQSRSSKGRTVAEHVQAQWPLRALLILAFGRELSWREHWATDSKFPIWMLDGSTRDGSGMRVQTRRTVSDFERPEPELHEYSFPLLRLHDLGNAGLTRWFRLYDDETFRRAVEPVVEVINGASRFHEPQLLMTAMSLEAMGHYRDPKRTKDASVAAHIKRCMEAIGHDWSPIGRVGGIAEALARSYNGLKHVDKGHRPDSFELSLLTPLAILIMRLQLFDLLRLPSKVRTAALDRSFYQVARRFTANGVTISTNGNLKAAT